MKVKNSSKGMHSAAALVWISAVLWWVASCTPDKDLIATLSGYDLWPIAWSHDGTQLAVVDGTQVNIWNTDTWTKIRSLGDGSTEILDVVWRSDGSELATTDFQKNLTLWDAASGDARARIEIDNYFPGTLFWPANSDEILAFFADNHSSSVEIIHAGSSSLSTSLLEVEQLNSYADDLCWLRIAEDESLSVIRILDYNFDGSISQAIQGTCSPGGVYFAAYNTDQRQLNIWNLQTSQQITSNRHLPLDPSSSTRNHLFWSPDGRKLISGEFMDNRFYVWDSAYPDQLNTIAMPEDTITFIANGDNFSWSPDGSRVALVAGPVPVHDITPRILVLIWDMDQLKLIQTIRMDAGDTSIRGFAWHPDSRQIAVVGTGRGAPGVQVWHVN